MRLFEKIKIKKAELLARKVEGAHLFKRYFFLIIGVTLYAISYNLFFYKNNIVYGGASGISIILKNVLDPYIALFILNLFFLTLSFFLLGRKQTINSLVGSLLYPLMIKLTSNIGNYITIDNDNLLLISIIGGVLVGLASGTVFKSGFTTGGTDILNQIVAKYFKTSIGTAMLMTDGLIVIVGGFFFGWTKVLYAMIVLYIINIMVDKVVLGISNNKAIYINTTEEDSVSNYLLNGLKLGITLIETRGGYTNKKNQMIMCVAPTSQYFEIKEGISQIDPKAVILVTDAYQASRTYHDGYTEIN